jgi:low affinity Fe/Cu permease
MRDRRFWERGVEHLSTRASEWTGSTTAFICSLMVIGAWMVSGPLFHYSDTWQLIINTVTNVVTFVMVFVIQRAQNKDSLAVQIKLSELLAAVRGATDGLVAVEELSEDALRALHARYLELARAGARPSAVTLESATAIAYRDESRNRDASRGGVHTEEPAHAPTRG